MSNRRNFITQSVLTVSSVFVMGANAATSKNLVVTSTIPLVLETDTQAKSLGYVANTLKADIKKYPKHKDTQKCSTCALYQGKVDSKEGPCPLFPGKHVVSQGWCSAFAQKA